MVLQMKNSLCSFRIYLDTFIPPLWNIRMLLFLSLFLVFVLSTKVEAKSLATSTYKNVTIVSKAGRYLTIGRQGITGEYSYSSYAKLEVHTVGFNGEITIKALKIGKYLAMNSTGNVCVVASETQETVFIDLRKITTPFTSFRSKSHSSRYLAISGTGSVSGSTNATNSDNTMFALFPAV